MKDAGVLKWEDLQNHALPQDFADMLGWREMAEKTAKAYHSLNDSEQKRTMIFCDNYGMAGAVNFYRHQYNLPEAYSDNASFLYWLPDSIKWDNILLITSDKDEMQHDFIKYFQSARITDSTTVPFSREEGDFIILLQGASEKMKDFFRKKIEADKK